MIRSSFLSLTLSIVSRFLSTFQLLAGQQFVDVTLACDGHQVHAHRLVLAACSSYFESLLSENPCKHPIIILPKDIKLWEVQALIDFCYKGQVNVSQAGLPQLLKCAETLQIRGLCGTDSTLNEVANGKIDRCLDPNLLAGGTANNCSSSNFPSFSSMFASSNLLNPTYHSDDEQQQQQQHLPPSSLLQHTFRPLHSDLLRTPTATAKFVTTAAVTTAAAAAATDNNTAKSINHRSNESLVKTKPHKIVIHNDKSTKEHCNANPTSTTKQSLKRLNGNEVNICNTTTSSTELNIKCEEFGKISFSFNDLDMTHEDSVVACVNYPRIIDSSVYSLVVYTIPFIRIESTPWIIYL